MNTGFKRIWLYERIKQIKNQSPTSFNQIVIERSFILRDSMEQFRTIPDLNLHNTLKVFYIHEEAQDAGGLIRDWFCVLIEILFDQKLGLFRKAQTAELSYVFNEFSGELIENDLEFCYFTGQIIGKALYERCPIKAFLNKAIIKFLLGIKLNILDMESYDEQFYKSLIDILHMNLNEENLDIFFSVTEYNPKKDIERSVDLINNGRNILVTEETKEQFIELL